jgi:hypothetical protein
LNSSIEEEDDAFDKDWIWLGAEKDTDFSSYRSLDSGLATFKHFQHL